MTMVELKAALATREAELGQTKKALEGYQQ